MNSGRTQLGGAGILTSMLVFGGSNASTPTITAKTESYNGTNWAEEGDLATARSQFGGSAGASNTAGLAIGGFINPSTQSTAAEEFTGAGATVTRTFTDS